MTDERRRNEKDEKDEKNEKDRGEGMEEKWRRDPLSAIFFGLFVVVVGLFFLLAAVGVIAWDEWWTFFLMGIGVVFIVEALVRYAMPAHRRPMFGRLLMGLILLAVGAAFLFGLQTWWPAIVVAVGVAIVVFGLTRLSRPKD
ncbi:MAG: hypothetical protein SV910_04420 [Chloroflexota bacterium]|nr:hypothetical protein [Chloroflexota bacterium]